MFLLYNCWKEKNDIRILQKYILSYLFTLGIFEHGKYNNVTLC